MDSMAMLLEIRTDIAGLKSGMSEAAASTETYTAAIEKQTEALMANAKALSDVLAKQTAGAAKKATGQAVQFAKAYQATGNALQQPSQLLSSLYGNGSQIMEKRYLTSISGVRNALARANEEFKHTVVIHNGVASVLSQESNTWEQHRIKMDMVARTAENLNQKYLNLGKNLQWTGRQLMVGVTASIGAVGAFAVKSFMDIQTAAKQASVYVGQTALPALEAGAKQTASVWGTSMSDMITANAQFQKSMGTTPAVTKQLGDLAAAIDQLGNINNMASSTKLVQTLQEHTGNVAATTTDIKQLALVAQNTAINLTDMVAVLPQAMPIFNNFNMSVTQGAGLLSAFKQNGLDASSGITTLRMALSRLGAADSGSTTSLKQLQKQLDLINQTTGTAISFFDKNGNVNATQGLQTLAQAWVKLTAAQQQSLQAQLGMRGAGVNIAAVINSISQAYGLQTKNVDGTTSAVSDYQKAMDITKMSADELSKNWDKVVQQFQKDPTQQFKVMIQQIKIAASEIGGALMPYVLKLVNFVEGLVTKFNNLSPAVKKFVGEFMVGAAAAGPFIYALGQMQTLLFSMTKGPLSIITSFMKLKTTPVSDALGGKSFVNKAFNGSPEIEQAWRRMTDPNNPKAVTGGPAAGTFNALAKFSREAKPGDPEKLEKDLQNLYQQIAYLTDRTTDEIKAQLGLEEAIKRNTEAQVKQNIGQREVTKLNKDAAGRIVTEAQTTPHQMVYRSLMPAPPKQRKFNELFPLVSGRGLGPEYGPPLPGIPLDPAKVMSEREARAQLGLHPSRFISNKDKERVNRLMQGGQVSPSEQLSGVTQAATQAAQDSLESVKKVSTTAAQVAVAEVASEVATTLRDEVATVAEDTKAEIVATKAKASGSTRRKAPSEAESLAKEAEAKAAQDAKLAEGRSMIDKLKAKGLWGDESGAINFAGLTHPGIFARIRARINRSERGAIGLPKKKQGSLVPPSGWEDYTDLEKLSYNGLGPVEGIGDPKGVSIPTPKILAERKAAREAARISIPEATILGSESTKVRTRMQQDAENYAAVAFRGPVVPGPKNFKLSEAHKLKLASTTYVPKSPIGLIHPKAQEPMSEEAIAELMGSGRGASGERPIYTKAQMKAIAKMLANSYGTKFQTPGEDFIPERVGGRTPADFLKEITPILEQSRPAGSPIIPMSSTRYGALRGAYEATTGTMFRHDTEARLERGEGTPVIAWRRKLRQLIREGKTREEALQLASSIQPSEADMSDPILQAIAAQEQRVSQLSYKKVIAPARTIPFYGREIDSSITAPSKIMREFKKKLKPKYIFERPARTIDVPNVEMGGSIADTGYVRVSGELKQGLKEARENATRFQLAQQQIIKEGASPELIAALEEAANELKNEKAIAEDIVNQTKAVYQNAGRSQVGTMDSAISRAWDSGLNSKTRGLQRSKVTSQKLGQAKLTLGNQLVEKYDEELAFMGQHGFKIAPASATRKIGNETFIKTLINKDLSTLDVVRKNLPKEYIDLILGYSVGGLSYADVEKYMKAKLPASVWATSGKDIMVRTNNIALQAAKAAGLTGGNLNTFYDATGGILQRAPGELNVASEAALREGRIRGTNPRRAYGESGSSNLFTSGPFAAIAEWAKNLRTQAIASNVETEVMLKHYNHQESMTKNLALADKEGESFFSKLALFFNKFNNLPIIKQTATKLMGPNSIIGKSLGKAGSTAEGVAKGNGGMLGGILGKLGGGATAAAGTEEVASTGGSSVLSGMGAGGLGTVVASAGPFLAIAAAIAGAIALIVVNWNKVSKGIGSGLTYIKAAFKSFLDDIVGPFKNLLEEFGVLGSTSSGTAKDINKTWKDVGKALDLVFHTIGYQIKTIGALIRPVMDIVAGIWGMVAHAALFVISVLTLDWGNAWQQAKAIVADMAKGIVNAMVDIAKASLIPFNTMIDLAEKVPFVGKALSSVGINLKDFKKQVNDSANGLSSLGQSLADDIMGTTQVAADAGKKTADIFAKAYNDELNSQINSGIPAAQAQQTALAMENAMKAIVNSGGKRIPNNLAQQFAQQMAEGNTGIKLSADKVATDFINAVNENLAAQHIDPSKATPKQLSAAQAAAAKQIGNEINQYVQTGMDSQPLELAPVDTSAANDALSGFVSEFQTQMKTIMETDKKAATDAFTDYMNRKLKSYDDQTKAIDNQITALQDQQKEEQKLNTLLDDNNKITELGAQLTVDRSAALATGDFSGARNDTLKYGTDLADAQKKLTTDQQGYDTQTKIDALTAQKDTITKAKEAAQQELQIKQDTLQKSLDMITQFTPKTAAEAKKQQDAITAALAAAGVDTQGVAEANAQFVPDAWNTAMKNTITAVDDKQYWTNLASGVSTEMITVGEDAATAFTNAILGFTPAAIAAAATAYNAGVNGTGTVNSSTRDNPNIGNPFGGTVNSGPDSHAGGTDSASGMHSAATGSALVGAGIKTVYSPAIQTPYKTYLQSLGVVPKMDLGGVVLGDGIAKVHKGEVVASNKLLASGVGQGDTNVHLHFDGGFFGSNAELNKLVDVIERQVMPKLNRRRGLENRTFSTYG